MCSLPRCSNIRVPPPRSTGTRWIEISSISPALMYCCPISAPPITAMSLSPADGLRLLESTLDPAGHEGVDAPFGYLPRLGVGDDEHRNPCRTRRAVPHYGTERS